MTDYHTILFSIIKEHYDWRAIQFTDEPIVPIDTDVIITFGGPEHSAPASMCNLLDLDNGIKLIGMTGDVHSLGNKKSAEMLSQYLDRCDVILSGAYRNFLNNYSQFENKYVFFPQMFASHDRYANLSFNSNPRMQCLLPGNINQYYPLRQVIAKYVDGKKIVRGTCSKIIRSEYAKLLNSFFCAVTSGLIFNYAVAKYFEIPATGSLLIANETEDSIKAGLISNEHFVPITKDNAQQQIYDCLDNYEAYQHIRRQGMEYVRANHSVNNRALQLINIIDGLFGG